MWRWPRGTMEAIDTEEGIGGEEATATHFDPTLLRDGEHPEVGKVSLLVVPAKDNDAAFQV